VLSDLVSHAQPLQAPRSLSIDFTNIAVLYYTDRSKAGIFKFADVLSFFQLCSDFAKSEMPEPNTPVRVLSLSLPSHLLSLLQIQSLPKYHYYCYYFSFFKKRTEEKFFPLTFFFAQSAIEFAVSHFRSGTGRRH
jgi:hypothetical protein